VDLTPRSSQTFSKKNVKNDLTDFAKCVSSVWMTRTEIIRRRGKLASGLSDMEEVLRGSLLERTVHHSSGCPKCARGEGHPLWVLNVNYPGAKTRQLSLRAEQVPQVRKALERYRQVKETLEAISELNQQLLRMDRDESRQEEREA
jgi:hypothetical protein